MRRALFSVFAWTCWVLHLAVLGPLAILATLIDPTGWGFRITQLGTRSAFFFGGLRVVQRGHVDWSRSYVLMGNHQNMLDPFALLLLVPHHVAGVEKMENAKIPVYGQLSRAWGNIAIKREDKDDSRAGIAEAVARLKRGLSIAIMPEGTRTKDGSVGPFKKGGFHMAIDAQADILPFTINGGFERFQTGDWRVNPGTIEVVWGEPISTQGLTKADVDALLERTRAAVLANFRPGELPGA